MSSYSVWLLGGALCLFGSGAGAAPSLTTLYTFHGPDGSEPTASLALDQDGNLYGTTVSGGPGTSAGSPDGNGTIFELSGYNHFKFRTVRAFDDSDNTPSPDPVLFDSNGDIFGSTDSGGVSGRGLVFELSGNRHQVFTDLADIGLVNGLVFDVNGASFQPGVPYRTGDLIGLTGLGGSNNTGEIFALSGDHYSKLSGLYNDPADQALFDGPNAPMIADAFGNLFGTTGGYTSAGSIFELSGQHHHVYTTLATFDRATTGSFPTGGLSLDKFGNLYGVTMEGGPNGGGTIFELSGVDHRQLTCLHGFRDNGDQNGTEPNGPLAIDAAGQIFGATYSGGIDGGRLGSFGTLFKLSSDHKTYTVIYRFTAYADGAAPQAGLIADRAGNLYGATSSGGLSEGLGTVFKLSNAGFVPHSQSGEQ